MKTVRRTVVNRLTRPYIYIICIYYIRFRNIKTRADFRIRVDVCIFNVERINLVLGEFYHCMINIISITYGIVLFLKTM